MRRIAVVLLMLAGCAPNLKGADAQGLAEAVRARPVQSIAGFLQVVGAARVVGLGYPVAGAEQVPGLMENGMLVGLVRVAGFSGMALDVDATAARALDSYVRGEAVDIDAALAALGEPWLATTEFRATLDWMRGRNVPGGGIEVDVPLVLPVQSADDLAPTRQLRVFGLDPRDADAAAAAVLTYLGEVDPAYVPEARSLLGGDQRAIDAVLERMDAKRDEYAGADPGAWVEARQLAEVTAQARRMAETWEFEAREFARARNAEWALAQLGGGKLIVVAHNRHVAAEVQGAAPSMGNFLRQWFGADYRPIGATFAGGQVRGEGCDIVAVQAAPGSLDAALAAGGEAWALLDLRGRQGALQRPQRVGDEVLRPAVAFDAIWTVAQVHPGTPLGSRCARKD